MDNQNNKDTKTPKHLQTNETAGRIFYHSMRLFLAKGYHGTSIDDITQAAGITKGALYWHFTSKEDVLKKIAEEFENRYLNQMIHVVGEAKGGAVGKFERYFRFNAAFAYYNQELCVSFTTLAAELVGAHHEIETEIRRIYKKYQGFLSGIILEGKKEKVFRKDIDHAMNGLVIIAFHDGMLLQWFMNKDEINGKDFVRVFKKNVLKGLLA